MGQVACGKCSCSTVDEKSGIEYGDGDSEVSDLSGEVSRSKNGKSKQRHPSAGPRGQNPIANGGSAFDG